MTSASHQPHDPLHRLQGGEHIPFSRPPTPNHKDAPQVGFIGLGAMGRFMARNLAKNRSSHPSGSPPMVVWNRTISKAESLAKEVGGDKMRAAQSPAEVATECDIIVTNLANDEVVVQIYEEFAKALTEHRPTKNKIFVETSTIHPKVAGQLDKLISQISHCHLVTSPVFGAPTAADKADLIIAMSGDYRSKKEVAHLFVPAIGRKVYDLGGNLEKAPTFKLIGNSLILGCLEVLGEGLTMGEKSGIGQENVKKLVNDILPAELLMKYSEKMMSDSFDGSQGFAIDGGIKDATHIRSLSTTLSCPMPAIDIAHQHLLTARSIHQSQALAGRPHYGTLDWSSLVAGSRVAAGLDAFDSEKHQHVVRDE